MAEPESTVPKVTLTEHAPKDLKEFVACTTNKLKVDCAGGDFGWVGRAMGFGSESPKVTYTPTPGKENRGTLVVDFERPYSKPVEIAVSVKDGKLELEASSGTLKPTIERFATQLNAALAAADEPKCIGDIAYDRDKRVLTITKNTATSVGSAGADRLEKRIAELEATTVRGHRFMSMRVTNHSNDSYWAEVEAGAFPVDALAGAGGTAVQRVEIPGRSRISFTVGVRLDETASSVDGSVDNLVAGPVPDRTASAVVTRPIGLHYDTPTPTGFEFDVGAEITPLDVGTGSSTDVFSEWVGVAPATGRRSFDIGTRFALADGPLTTDDTGRLPIEVEIPHAALGSAGTGEPFDWSQIQPRIGLEYEVKGDSSHVYGRLPTGATTVRQTIFEATGEPARIWHIETRPDGSVAHPWFDDLWFDAGSDAAGCLRQGAIWGGAAAVIAAIVTAIIAFGGGDGDTVTDAGSDATGGDEQPADEPPPDDQVGVGEEEGETSPTNESEDEQGGVGGDAVGVGGDSGTTTRSGESFFAGDAVDLGQGRLWDVANTAIVGEDGRTVTLLILYPVTAGGTTPVIVVLLDMPPDEVDLWAIELFQQNVGRQHCSNSDEAAAFGEGIRTNLYSAASGGVCTLEFDPTQAAAAHAYRADADGAGSLLALSGMTEPFASPVTGTMIFELSEGGGFVEIDVSGRGRFDITPATGQPGLIVDVVSGATGSSGSAGSAGVTVIDPSEDAPGSGGLLDVAIALAEGTCPNGSVEFDFGLTRAWERDADMFSASINVTIDDGRGGRLTASAGQLNGEDVSSGFDLRDLENLPPLDVNASFDGTRVTLAVGLPSDFVLGPDAHFVYGISLTPSLEEDPFFTESIETLFTDC